MMLSNVAGWVVLAMVVVCIFSPVLVMWLIPDARHSKQQVCGAEHAWHIVGRLQGDVLFASVRCEHCGAVPIGKAVR